jgi:hypothetical protein
LIDKLEAVQKRAVRRVTGQVDGEQIRRNRLISHVSIKGGGALQGRRWIDWVLCMMFTKVKRADGRNCVIENREYLEPVSYRAKDMITD